MICHSDFVNGLHQAALYTWHVSTSGAPRVQLLEAGMVQPSLLVTRCLSSLQCVHRVFFSHGILQD